MWRLVVSTSENVFITFLKKVEGRGTTKGSPPVRTAPEELAKLYHSLLQVVADP